MPDAIALIDKPAGWTSHDVVARARRVFGTRRVGHAGTLDPMATGLLIVGVDRGTRLLTYLVGLDKTYEATIRLGATTVTDDAEGEITGRAEAAAVAAVDQDAILTAIREHLTGRIEQVPSAVSAIKVNGVRSYARVRAGEDVALPPRPITVHGFEVTDVRRPSAEVIDIDATVRCSSGTYIRALARDLGALLGVGGHLTALRRTHVGPFDVADASELPARGVPDSEIRVPPTLTLAEAAGRVLPVRILDDREADDLSHGRHLSLTKQSGPVAAVDAQARLRGILSDERGKARPSLVIPTPVDDASSASGPAAAAAGTVDAAAPVADTAAPTVNAAAPGADTATPGEDLR